MSEEFNNLNCASCGIAFGFPKAVEEIWRKSKKQFYCPNGHSLTWSGPTPAEKELQASKEKIVDLEKKLTATLEEIEIQKKKIEELTTELEIWKPSTTENLGT